MRCVPPSRQMSRRCPRRQHPHVAAPNTLASKQVPGAPHPTTPSLPHAGMDHEKCIIDTKTPEYDSRTLSWVGIANVIFVHHVGLRTRLHQSAAARVPARAFLGVSLRGCECPLAAAWPDSDRPACRRGRGMRRVWPSVACKDRKYHLTLHWEAMFILHFFCTSIMK